MSSPPNNLQNIFSFLTPEEVREIGGLPFIAIQGTFNDPQCTPAGFKVNETFVEFMHDVIRAVGPSDPSMQEAAAKPENGWVYVIVLRTPEDPQGRVPIEDIIGRFYVRDGRLAADSYQPNKGYQVFTKHGAGRLPLWLREALVRAVRKLAHDAKKSRTQ